MSPLFCPQLPNAKDDLEKRAGLETEIVHYLLMWNCKHLANANKFEHLHVLHARRRLVSPMIVTPEQLLELEP